MDAKKFSNVLWLALKALLVSIILQPALCNTGCKRDQNLTDSTVYALEVTSETILRAAVKIYSKICTVDVEAVGPRWYRLDVIGSARDLGQFIEPWEFSGAVQTAEGIEFSSEDPLILLDLPRRYKWETKGDLLIKDTKLCFRLVIQEGNYCKQVVTNNCTAELQQQRILEEENEKGSAEEDITPTTAAEADTEATFKDLIELYTLGCIAGNPRLNCTRKRVKPTCGTNNIWYKNTCTLRLHRCIYNIVTLQRDLSNKSCTDPPPTYFPPPTLAAPPTTMAPRTPQPCSEARMDHKQAGHLLVPRCLDHTSFRPIQCWALEKSSAYCSCTDPLTGASTRTWTHSCPPSPLLTQPPQLQCGF